MKPYSFLLPREWWLKSSHGVGFDPAGRWQDPGRYFVRWSDEDKIKEFGGELVERKGDNPKRPVTIMFPDDASAIAFKLKYL